MANRAADIGDKDTRECVLTNKVEAVVNKATGKNYDYNSLKSNVKEHLLKIELIIGEKFTRRDEAIEFLKSHKAIPFSPASLAVELDMSRNTIYRNDVLKDYIEHYDTAFKEDNPYNTIDELKGVIAELQVENTKLKHVAIDTEILKHEIRELNRTIVEKSAEITKMQIDIQDLQAAKYELEKVLAKRNSDSNVSQLKFNT